MKLLLVACLLLAVAPVHAAVPDPAPKDEVLVYSQHFALTPQFVQVAGGTMEKPWYSTKNLSIAAGASYRWWNGGDAENLSPNKEFVFGLYNAWQMTQRVDLVGNVEYGVDTKSTGFTVGARYVLKMPE